MKLHAVFSCLRPSHTRYVTNKRHENANCSDTKCSDQNSSHRQRHKFVTKTRESKIAKKFPIPTKFVQIICVKAFTLLLPCFLFPCLWCNLQLHKFLHWWVVKCLTLPLTLLNSLFTETLCFFWHNTSLSFSVSPSFSPLFPASPGDPWGREDADQCRAGGGRRPGGGEGRRQDPRWPPHHLLPRLQGGLQAEIN